MLPTNQCVSLNKGHMRYKVESESAGCNMSKTSDSKGQESKRWIADGLLCTHVDDVQHLLPQSPKVFDHVIKVCSDLMTDT